MNESQKANTVIQICRLKEQGLSGRDINYLLDLPLGSVGRILKTAFAKRIRKLFGI